MHILFSSLILLVISTLLDPTSCMSLTRNCTVDGGAISRRPLEGVKLRCCIPVAPPYAYRHKSRHGGFGGWSLQHFENLQERTGFKCSYIRSDQTYNNFIEDLASCTARDGSSPGSSKCDCDIGIGSWRENTNRTLGYFLPSHGQETFVVLTNVNNTQELVHGAFFITAFTPGVWLAITSLFLCFIGLKIMDPVISPRKYRGEQSRSPRMKRWKIYLLKDDRLYALRRAIQSAAGRMLPNSDMSVPNSESPRKHWLLNFIITVCGLFLFLVYEATMTASMVSEKRVSAFRTEDDLRSGRIGPEDVCFKSGDAVETYWRNTMKSEKNGIGDEDPLPSLLNGTCKFLLTFSGMGERAVNGEQRGKIVKTGEPFLSRGVSFVVPHGFKYTQALRKASVELQALHLTPSLEHYVIQDGSPVVQGEQKLTPRQLYLFFVVVSITSGFIFLEMVMDRDRDLHPDAPTSDVRRVEEF